MYSSDIGVNGPVTYSIVNTDGTATDKATIDSSTGVLTTLQAGTIEFRVTYAGAPTYWYNYIDIKYDDGVYFVYNSAIDKYMKTDNNGNFVVQYDFEGKYSQNWEIQYRGNGYYTIKSDYFVDLYLTAPSDYSEGSKILLQNYSSVIENRQLWKITRLSNGRCKIQAKSHEMTDLVIAISSISSGGNITQQQFYNDTNYVDEWNLYKCVNGTEVFLLGIDDIGHDHESSLTAIQDDMFKLGYEDINFQLSGNFSVETVKSYMDQCRIFVTRCHGNSDENGTFLSLGVSMLSSNDIFNFDTSEAIIDLTGCDLMLFIACRTGNHATQSLPHAAVRAGATCAIGFRETINCSIANEWTQKFFEYYSQGDTVEQACQKAVNDVMENNNNDDGNLGSFIIVR